MSGENYAMPESEFPPYRNYEIRDRIEAVNERTMETKGRIESHEMVCAQRYAQILKDIAELKAYVTMISKVGALLAFILFAMEFGKATFPTLFEVIEKGLH